MGERREMEKSSEKLKGKEGRMEIGPGREIRVALLQ